MPFDIKQLDSFTYITDENGDITSLSPAIYYVLGYHPDELRGKSFASLAARESFGRSSAIMYQLLQGRQSFKATEMGLACKDGRTLEAEISGRPVLEGAHFRGYQGVVLVISEYRHQPEAPGRAEREAELVLDLVCHDIHNMNQVQAGYLELAMESLSPDSPAYRYIQKCMAMVTGSSELLRNVQKLQQISTGIRTLEKVDPGKVLAIVVREFSDIRGRDVRINFARGPECPIMANSLLKDAFTNIIGNAIQHSRGPLVIDIRLEKLTGPDKNYCQVTIDDNGPGIPDAMKRRLFNRFERGEAPASGKGLGLYLVRKLIEGYGGRVLAEDRVPGDHRQGSRFIVILPVAEN